MKQKIDIRFVVLVAIILLVSIWRIIEKTNQGIALPPNFTPIGAMALFGGAYFSSKSKYFLFPLLILFISDFVLMQTIYAKYSNGLLYSGWFWTYGAFAMMALVGKVLIKRVSFKNVFLSALLAGGIHFILANLGVWLGGGMNMSTGLPLTRDFNGLIACYIQSIPFFKNMLAGNLVYSTVLFGGFELAKSRFAVLREPKTIL